jgi:hypothetical protein
MNRRVEPEWLDSLPAEDPGAIGSRRDLRRLNRWMGNASIMARALGSFPANTGSKRLVEIGAGDGHFLSRVAQRLGAAWRGTYAALLDRQNLLTAEMAQRFRKLAWDVEVTTCDVFDWCRDGDAPLKSIVVSNLFLHHFETKELMGLLPLIAQRSRFFVAVEPRRSALALAFSRLAGFIGCNAVTCHDAPVSVRAGFRRRELSQLWGGDETWVTHERPAGAFSHLFIAWKQPV